MSNFRELTVIDPIEIHCCVCGYCVYERFEGYYYCTYSCPDRPTKPIFNHNICSHFITVKNLLLMVKAKDRMFEHNKKFRGVRGLRKL